VNEFFSFIKVRVYFENTWGLGWQHVLLGGYLMLEYVVIVFLLYHICSLQAMLCWIISSKLKY
jgi:hypothetical protein